MAHQVAEGITGVTKAKTPVMQAGTTASGGLSRLFNNIANQGIPVT